MVTRESYLSGTCLVVALLTGLAGAARADEALDKAAADPNSWSMYGRGYDNTRCSPLNQITPENIGQMKLAYSFQLGPLRSDESSPIVIGDTMDVPTSWGPRYVYALNAATGQRKWTYEPEIPDDVLQLACCDVNSRGVSFADRKIFVGRLDGKLASLDAATGKELWVSTTATPEGGALFVFSE